MRQEEIHRFLERFFTANGCTITDKSAGHLTVQLTAEVDKQIMNRPFYWHWLEKTGGEPNPMKITLITDEDQAPADLEGEFIHFGSPRLFQMFQAVKKNGKFIRLYEKICSQGAHIPLEPWLGINVTISYQSDKKKDKLLSLGLHLISGQLIEGFQEQMEARPLSSQISDYCYTMSPLIKPESGIKRLERYIEQSARNEPLDWAEASIKRWKNDLELLNQFYEETEEKPEEYEIEKKALQTLYEPKIEIKVENGGLFYLQKKISG
ncbi:YqhG family protein [Bacillus swezeyi]|uniref:YqhG family protein n=1 Tax=Bacillus swezeyi TaxID=1925020 RepID=UPI003F8A7972